MTFCVSFICCIASDMWSIIFVVKYITAIPKWEFGVWNYRLLGWLFKSVFVLASLQPSNLRINLYFPVKFVCGFLQRRPVIQKEFHVVKCYVSPFSTENINYQWTWWNRNDLSPVIRLKNVSGNLAMAFGLVNWSNQRSHAEIWTHTPPIITIFQLQMGVVSLFDMCKFKVE